MSNKKTEDSPFAGLENLNLGPAWARDKGSDSKNKPKRSEERGKKSGPRHKKGPSNSRDYDNKNRSYSNKKREGQGYSGGERKRPFRAEAPTWVEGSVMPVEESLDNLANEIKGSARTYQVFELARTVLKERNRFRVNFEAKGTDKKFYRIRPDNSVWLSKEEALKHFLSSEELWGDLYKKESKEVEAPSGNYSSIAKCGFSGEILGPPNFHGYQQKVNRIHREQFSNMTLEAYKNRISTERSEEAVAAWLESEKTVDYYIPRSELPAEKEIAEPVKADEEAAETSAEVTEEVLTDVVESTKVAEAPAEAVAVSEESSEATPAATSEKSYTELASRQELERHFIENYYSKVIEEAQKAWVVGDIEGKKLSAPLLTVLKNVVSEERRYPGKLSAILCRQMSGRHIAVYKWERKLRAGPARPKSIAQSITLSDRIQNILTWITENRAGDIKAMWAAVLPEGTTEEEKHLWYADLHWLISEGYIVFTSEGYLYVAKAPEAKKPEKEVTKAEESAPASAPEEEAKEVVEAPKTEEETKTSNKVEESA